MCKKIYNPKEAICLIIYIDKKTIIDISKKLYEKRNTRIADWMKELLKEKKIIVKPNIDHIRKPYYQTRPNTILNYIIKRLKQINIALNDSEKKQVFKHLKSEEFKNLVILMVDNLDVKSEHFSFSGLIDDLSLRCIFEYNRHQFLKAKGVPLNKIKDEKLSLLKMPYRLLGKLGSLYHNAYVINKHYENFILMINGVYQIEKKYNNKVNGNGHGLA